MLYVGGIIMGILLAVFGGKMEGMGGMLCLFGGIGLALYSLGKFLGFIP